MPRYNPAVIEPKWQKFWDEQQTFKTPDMPEGEKAYLLDMFPYPSGAGLHVGHPEGYTATDIKSRFLRMKGVTVLHPMGFDSFGLPAEEHAIKTGTPPRQNTEENIATFTRQLKMLGFSYDWDRCIATTDEDYFKWTQWIFLVLYDTWYDEEAQKGRPISELPIPDVIQSQGEEAVLEYQNDFRLAYELEAPVNWCPELGTVLANEEVVGGVSERGGYPVVRMPLRQWMLRITAYGDRLLSDLEPLDWTDSVKALQRNWIGRSTGAEVDFFIGSEANKDGKPSSEAFENYQKSRGKSGFPRSPGDDVLRIYTTRPDTLLGATYMVIAPEHPAVERLTTSDKKEEVEAYREAAASKSDLDRTELAKDKTGVFTGSYAINPVNGEPVPIWVADYVLISYGTGAIMAVPAHDERDFEFAEKFEIPIIAVVDPADKVDAADRDEILAGKKVFPEHGTAFNSGKYDGLSTQEFKEKIASDLESAGTGKEAVNYKLRDWLFCRQRFWGEPFPLLLEVDEEGKRTGPILPVSVDELPVRLPHLDDYKPHGRPEPPLDKAPEDWLFVERNGKRYKRETNTMPQWAGSCWYYLRYIDPKNDECFVDPEKEKAWMPVDLYIGGAEHAVLHLLYARFWHKVLYDRGHVSSVEPFHKLVNQGMILGETEFTGFKDSSENWVSSKFAKVTEEGGYIHKKTGDPLTAIKVNPEETKKKGEGFTLESNPEIRIDSRAHKMSKSRGNVINPDDVVKDYGADSLRLYEMFMGPLEAVKPWSMSGVNGIYNFLQRVWRLIVEEQSESLELSAAVQDAEPTEEHLKILHKTIKDVTNDIDRLFFNTAIARMMEFTNYFTKESVRPRAVLEPFILLLSPYAPHLCEELWSILGKETTLAYEPWPKFDEKYLVEDTINIPVQVNGKKRAVLEVSPDASQEELIAAAKQQEKVITAIGDKSVVKEIVIPKKMINLVVK